MKRVPRITDRSATCYASKLTLCVMPATVTPVLLWLGLAVGNQKLTVSAVHTKEENLGWSAIDRYIGAEDTAVTGSISVGTIEVVPSAVVVAQPMIVSLRSTSVGTP